MTDPIALLKQLEVRVQSGADWARGVDPAAPSPSNREPGQRRPGAPRIAELLRHAESLAGGGCTVIRTQASLCGRRSREGYVCPTAPASSSDKPARDSTSPIIPADSNPVPSRDSLAPLTDAFALLGRDERWRDVDPERIAFVDIETTGLSSGTGTFAFLIGVGGFTGGAFEVRQYFAEDFCDEDALIDAVAEDLATAEGLVTYNGKSFDIPILDSRWRMTRRRPAFPALHMDLLHPVRSIWKPRLPDCRLETVEREVLRILRVSDVNGRLIPEIYFDYVRGFRPEQAVRVVDHHAQDIYSLGSLAAALAAAFADPADARFQHAADQAGLARLMQRAGRVDEAVAALERAICAARDEDFGFRLSMLLARQMKRLGRFDEAADIWKARAHQARVDRLDPLIELAKLAEHTLKDLAEAQTWTERALRIAESHAEFASWMGEVDRALARRGDQLDGLQRRLARIQHRARRAAGVTSRPASQSRARRPRRTKPGA